MFSDNYGLLLVDDSEVETKRSAVCVDPGDGEAILRAVDELKLDLKLILCTHKHNDHIGGNKEIRKRIPSVHIIGTAYEEIPEINTKAKEGDIFTFGNFQIRAIHAPCHTKGHVLYFVTNSNQPADLAPILFSGDTLFVGGCGRFFEGTATDMLRNMDRISELPSNTHVFCAHEYTESNLRFLSSMDPSDPSINKMMQQVSEKRRHFIPTLPTTIAEELNYNLFMKCRDKRTQQLLNCDLPEEAMAVLRSRKNEFK
jgi:hydroxyacylglutathione hydrolase